MFVALLILLFVAQPVNGPHRDSVPITRPYSAPAQIESNQHKDTTDNHFFTRLESAVKADTIAVYCKRIADKNEQESKSNLIPNLLLLFTMLGTWALAWVTIHAIKKQSSASHAQLVQSRIVARNQLNLAREIGEKQLRAYVGIDGAKALREADEIARFIVENFGKTPALKMSIRKSSGDFPANEIDMNIIRQHLETIEAAPAIIDPGHHVYITYLQSGINEEMMDGLRKGNTHVFFGRIDYTDIFGKDHWRTFCFVSNQFSAIETGDGRTLVKSTFQLHREGNETDDG